MRKKEKALVMAIHLIIRVTLEKIRPIIFKIGGSEKWGYDVFVIVAVLLMILDFVAVRRLIRGKPLRPDEITMINMFDLLRDVIWFFVMMPILMMKEKRAELVMHSLILIERVLLYKFGDWKKKVKPQIANEQKDTAQASGKPKKGGWSLFFAILLHYCNIYIIELVLPVGMHFVNTGLYTSEEGLIWARNTTIKLWIAIYAGILVDILITRFLIRKYKRKTEARWLWLVDAVLLGIPHFIFIVNILFLFESMLFYIEITKGYDSEESCRYLYSYGQHLVY